MSREVWITGYGLLSPFGETPADWLARLNDPSSFERSMDHETYSPFTVHPIGDYDIGSQIPKRGDQRAMGPLMHYGCYAAGLALDAAGIKGDEELLQRTHMVVASGGGERDAPLDRQILEKLESANDRGQVLNEQLSNELRPTLFLAQLPNLFAGNISIVHGVAGSSRTFMGEEPAGVDAMRIAFERIVADQGDLFLVGAAFNGERHELTYTYHAGGYLLEGGVGDLWERPKAGITMGSAGAFLVLEAREHAEARGAKPRVRVAGVLNDLSDRAPGAAKAAAQAQWNALSSQVRAETLPVMSGACGSGPISAEERDFLQDVATAGQNLAVRGLARAVGHSFDAAFIANAIYGIACIEAGSVFGPLSPESDIESAVTTAAAEQVLVTGWGFAQGEAMALLEAVDG